VIPDYQTLMRPVLAASANGEVRISDVVESIAGQFNLTQDERAELIPSGGQTILSNRVHWAKTYLKQAGLVEMTKRAHFRITESGKSVLSDTKLKIDNQLLRQFPEFIEFQNRGKTDSGSEPALVVEVSKVTETPEETLRAAYVSITEAVASELIDRLRTGTPAFFERTIVALLLAMGYGGSSEDAGRAIGQSGDDGVDGVIDQDPLGVDQIYVQAKRYAEGNQVGPAAIREFFGSLSLKKAQKGIFVTTSGFSKSAIETARQIGARIVLIDADQLGRLMVRHNVGCRDQEVLRIKRIDEDFFE
jgi:restriction system protein